MKFQDALNQLARETKRAQRHLALERALRAGLPFLLALSAWAALALSGLHARLPLLVQSVSAVLALAILIWLFSRARRAYRKPSVADARQRLARDSQLDPSAFDALGDQPARFDPLSVALWRREQDLARARAGAARAGPAQIQLDDMDRFKLRFVLPALVVIAALIAGAAAPDRLARAFLPDPGPLLGDREMAVEAWVTPADYTRAAPVSISDRLGEQVETPPSIEAIVRVTGPAGAPRLVFEGGGVKRSVMFTRAADGAWEAQLAIPGPGRLKIVRFHNRGEWRLAPATDAAPQAAFAAPIANLPAERARIVWSAKDDFGVTGMALRVRPLDPPEGLIDAAPVDVPFETPAGDPREAAGESELELAPHPYAGMEVEASIVAFDALGQAGESETMRFMMPEKVFLQPLARAAIEIRRAVLWERRGYRQGRAARTRTIPAGDILLGNQRIEIRDDTRDPPLPRSPEGIRHAARLLNTLTMEPSDGYFRDYAVFLGLKLARAELNSAQDIAETNIAAETLWLTALRAEFGGAADARRALEEAQRALAQALAEGAPRERIEQLMEAMRRATENYLQALVQEAMRQGQEPDTVEDTEEQVQLSGRDIQEMMNEVERLSQQGRHAEAQQMLQQLNDILNNLDVQLGEAQQQQGEGGEPGDQEQSMQQSLDQLSQAMGEQRALRDETQQRESEEGGGSGGQNEGGAGGDDLAERQAQIRQQLSEAQTGANESGAAESESLEAAGDAMREAENALRRGDLEGARTAQDMALEHMREGADGLASELRARGQQGREEGAGGPADPLGRQMPSGGVGDGESNVPTEFDPVRAREIMDEIRRRAQDPNRPEAEREYLRRLLDRFSGT